MLELLNGYNGNLIINNKEYSSVEEAEKAARGGPEAGRRPRGSRPEGGGRAGLHTDPDRRDPETSAGPGSDGRGAEAHRGRAPDGARRDWDPKAA